MTLVPEDHPDARAEYLDAVAYYEKQRVGLGGELIERIEAAIRDILSDPESWSQVPGWNEAPTLRSHRVKVFRFRVVYYVLGDQVRIIAYAHTSREPGYWRHRLEG